ncbi:carbon-nitrogen hydrolase family protein [Microbulbifer taiwanensis]|uniref:carbon-nitrogen hydrolase family protein n=1 Tax=Microbulbifer taiwanensis TaxID=986746 RepID=UPI00360F6A1D
MKDLCVGAVQMVSGASVADNLAQAERLLRQAAERGAQLVLLPENFAHLSDRGSADAAEPYAGVAGASADRQPIQYALQRWAAELGLWLVAGAVPLSEREDGSVVAGGRTRSACLVYDDRGALRARYDKMHLFDVEVADAAGRYRESASIEPGERPRAAASPWAQLGLSICFDLRFPELYRELATAGAEILFVPAAFTYVTGQAHWMTLLRARAVENGCYVVAANQGGEHSPSGAPGGTRRLSIPGGGDRRGRRGESVIIATLSGDKLKSVRERMPLLSMRRL